MKWLVMMIPMAFLMLACEKQGALEQAGEEIDEAFEDVKAGGETTGNKIDDAMDEARENVEDVIGKPDPN